MTTDPARPFGRVLTAMVTPLTEDGSSTSPARRSSPRTWSTGCAHDGLVDRRDDGGSPTLSDAEQRSVLEVVLDAVGDRATVVAGVGHQRHRALDREGARRRAAGRPRPAWSSRRTTTSPRRPACSGTSPRSPTATDLPVMLYDIPPRSVGADRGRDARPARRAPADRRGQGRQGRPRCGRLDARPHRPRVLQRRGHAEPPAAGARRGRRGQRGRPRRRPAAGRADRGRRVRRPGQGAGGQREPAAGLHRHLPHARAPSWSRRRCASSGLPGRPGAAAAGRRDPRADRAAAHRPRRRRHREQR